MNEKIFDWSGSQIIKNTVIQAKRSVIRNEDILIPTDLREWLTPPDSQEIKTILSSLNLPQKKTSGTFDKRAKTVWQYVAENINYVSDATSQLKQDFWQFPAETIALKKGDCEDCAFLMASLLLASGISPFCIRVVLGILTQENQDSSPHAWPIYKDEEGYWRILESTLDELPEDWPSADMMANPDSQTWYEPEICFNQYHVWLIGEQKISDFNSYISKRKLIS